MPTAYCPDGHRTYWHNRRGTRIADLTCATCGGGGLRRSVNRECENGTRYYGINPFLKVCLDGHAWKAKEKRRTPAIWHRGANQRAKRRWGPRGFAAETAHVEVADRVPGYTPDPNLSPYIIVVGVRGDDDYSTWVALSKATIYGWGKSYKQALDKATENGH
jgi:hypothetical protein